MSTPRGHGRRRVAQSQSKQALTCCQFHRLAGDAEVVGTTDRERDNTQLTFEPCQISAGK
jgi:hypothetical protein